MGEHSANVLGVRALLVAAICSLLTAVSFAAEHKSADTIITNARVYTVNRAHPWAEAIAINDQRITAVGSMKQIARWRGPKTEMIDAGGRLVLPGFFDSHIHFMEGALSLEKVNVDETKNVAEIQKMVKDFAAAHPDAPWVLGRGWSYPEFPGSMPDKKYLDEILPDRPVYIEGFDGHTGWANSKALELSGITKDTKNPPNGEIVRDPKTGEATGALKEDAANIVVRHLPAPTDEQRVAALEKAIAWANSVGLTRVVGCGNDTASTSDYLFLGLLREMEKHGKLTLRFSNSYYVSPEGLGADDWKTIRDLRHQYPPSDDWLTFDAAKFFLDGVVESHTAAMLAPYSDDPSQIGSLRWDVTKYRATVQQLDREGVQVYTHAIGDKAVRTALDAYEAAAAANHTHDARNRIEHIETISAQDIPRFGKLGVIASFQPLHAYPDEDTLDVWLKNAGPERGTRAWVWQSIAKTGGTLAFGSDWPVVTLNPWYGVQNAVTRQTRDGKPPGGFVPQERISLEQAIEGYTLGAAKGARREKTEGTIEPGKLADVIMLSQDLFKTGPAQIYKTEVVMTMVGGKVVHRTNAAQAQKGAAE
ncbi:MAG: amidohydrolase [Terriglobales bacterium]